jgi:hypothetical protein
MARLAPANKESPEQKRPRPLFPLARPTRPRGRVRLTLRFSRETQQGFVRGHSGLASATLDPRASERRMHLFRMFPPEAAAPPAGTKPRP